MKKMLKELIEKLDKIMDEYMRMCEHKREWQAIIEVNYGKKFDELDKKIEKLNKRIDILERALIQKEHKVKAVNDEYIKRMLAEMDALNTSENCGGYHD